MSAIDETIVREYFEQNGFLVRQLRKYQVQSRKKTSEEEIDLIVFNPAYTPSPREPSFFIFTSELPHIQRAVLSIRGWHTGRLTPATLRGSPELFKFLEETVVRQAERLFSFEDGEAGTGANLRKLLVTPGLPTQEPFRSQSIAMLREKGVDGIISFRAMLSDLIERVHVNLNYGKSDVLQLLRILKNYDLLKVGQMELFP